MARHFRVIRPASKPQTSIEALELAEEIQRIEIAMNCVRSIKGDHICESRADGEMQINSWLATLGSCLRYANFRLRRDFLAVEPPKKN